MELQRKAKWFSSSFIISLIIIFSLGSSKASAEYYLVAGEPCYDTYYVCHQKKKVHHKVHKVVKHKYKHYRHVCKRSPYGVSIHYVCPCKKVYVPGHCRCGRYVRGHWVYASVYTAQPTYYKDYGYHEDMGYGVYDYPYDPDLSTADDNAMVDPNMDIDY